MSEVLISAEMARDPEGLVTGGGFWELPTHNLHLQISREYRPACPKCKEVAASLCWYCFNEVPKVHPNLHPSSFGKSSSSSSTDSPGQVM